MPIVTVVRRFQLSPFVMALSAAFATLPAAAQSEAPRSADASARQRYDIPAGTLTSALNRFAQRAGVELSFDPALSAGKSSTGLRGDYGVEDGFAALLAGSGLRPVLTPNGAWSLQALPPEGLTVLPAVKVEAQLQNPFDRPPERAGLKADYQDSATKSSLSIRETPQAISVITRDSIEARQALDLNSALELAAGVSTAGKAFAGNSPRKGEGFVLRGQELDSNRDVRIDGFTAGGDHNNFDLAPFERVDVVKGPSSMLYGQGSLGGFINLLRKRPQAERSLQVSAQAGSYDTYRVEADAAGALNAAQTVLGQATLAYEDSGSFIDGVQSQRLVIAPGVQWNLSERTRLFADLIWQDDTFVASLGIPLRQDGNELKPPKIPRSFYFGVPSGDDSEASALHTTLRLEHELSDRWLTSLQLHHSRNRLLGLADSYGYGFDEDGNTPLYASWVGQQDESWAGELRVEGRFDAFGREHRLLAGAEKNRFDNLAWGGYTAASIGSANIYDGSLAEAPRIDARSLPRAYDGRVNGSNEAAFAQVMFSVLDRTRVLLGARYDRARMKDVFNGESATGDDIQDDKKLTGRVGLVQDFGDTLSAYAVYAQSFNPVLAMSRSGVLEPETGEGYEAGLKGEWLDGRLGATLAVFRQELDNRPIPDPTNGPNDGFQISSGLQRADGVEVEITGTPLPGWTLSLASSWLDAEYVDRLDPDYGKTPGGTIKRQTALYTSYELQGGALRGLGGGATLVSVGERIVLSGDNYVVGGYERLDLHAFYKGWQRWEVSLLLRNVTDETYVERVNSAYLYSHFFGSPRALLLRAQYRFDR